MNNRIEEYIAEVLTSVRCKKVHSRIREELQTHIEDLTQEFQSQGLEASQAVERAVMAMGDASDIGQQLNRQHKPQMGWSVLLLTVAFSVVGVLMMLIPQAPGRYLGSMESYLNYMGVGAALLIGAYFFDYTYLKKHAGFIYGIGITLVFLCYHFGFYAAGAKRYLSFGFMTVNIPAVVSLFYLISLSVFLERFRNQGWMGILKWMGLAFMAVASFMILPAAAYALFLVIAGGVLLLCRVYQNHFSANGKGQFLLITLLGGFLCLTAAIGFVMFYPYRLERILMFWNHGASDPLNSGWMYMISHKILMASSWIGKLSPIPEGDISWVMPDLTSDFALLNIIGNYGRLAGLAVIFIVMLFLIRIFTITNKVKHSFGRNLSLGCCLFLGIQFICNILMNLGCFPIMAVTLPFISYGGSVHFVNALCVGLILSVWRQNNILPADKLSDAPKSKKRIFLENKKLIIDFSNTID